MSLPTLDDFKIHLTAAGRQSELNGDDAELIDHLYSAVDIVEGVVGKLRDQDVTETHYGVSSPVLVLNRAPVTGVSSVLFGRSGASYVAADLLLDSESGVLRFLNGYRFNGDVTVAYSTGRETTPAAVRLAILIIGKSLWETQRGAQPLPLPAADEGVVNTSYAPAIPARAATLLEPFARGPRVA